MKARDLILGEVRRNSPQGEYPYPRYTSFDTADADFLNVFQRAAILMGAEVLDAPKRGDLGPWIIARFSKASRIVSAVRGLQGLEYLDVTASPKSFASIDVGVVRACFGVAETGSVCVCEAQMGAYSFPHLCEHLIVLLDEASIVSNLHEAYARTELRHATYGVLMSGPSATADIEGVLVRGAQGVRSLTVLISFDDVWQT